MKTTDEHEATLRLMIPSLRTWIIRAIQRKPHQGGTQRASATSIYLRDCLILTGDPIPN